MNHSKVTIGIPVYGVERFIERCSRSLFEQSYQNLEYIFVDDCSPDNSIKILSKIIKEYPLRENQVHIVRHEHNRGLAAARNTAVENATGEFLLWVDSDDYIDTDLVKLCVEKQAETDSDIVLFDAFELFSQRKKRKCHQRIYDIQKRTEALLARHTTPCLWGGMYRLSLYRNNNITAVEGVNNNEDYQVSPRLSYYSKSVSYIDQCLYYYDRRNEHAITNNPSMDYARQGWKSVEILRDFFSDKRESYLHAIDVATINRYAFHIKWCVLTNNSVYYKELKENLRSFHNWKISDVPLRFRPCILIDNFKLLRFYLLPAYKLRDILLYFGFYTR